MIERLGDRKSPLKSVDRFRRDVDTSSIMSGIDTFTDQAISADVVESSADALTCPKKIRARSSGTEPATRISASTATALRECRRACWWLAA